MQKRIIKQIKVRTCIECPYCKNKIPFPDMKRVKTGEFFCKKLSRYYYNKELPPPDDCPLEEMESHINTQTATAYDSGYKYGYEKAMQGTDKQLLDQYSKGWDDGAKEAVAPLVKALEDYNKLRPIEIDHIKQFLIFKDAIKESIEIARRETNG